jgi:hypothetical protein
MTVRIQVSKTDNFFLTILDTMIHWKNIYGVNSDYTPRNLNSNLDLTKLRFNLSRLGSDTLFYYRVKYRDHNSKWSDWSNAIHFNTKSNVKQDGDSNNFKIENNYPNPFNLSTKIGFYLTEKGKVDFTIFNLTGETIMDLAEEVFDAGKNEIVWNGKMNNGETAKSGVYI